MSDPKAPLELLKSNIGLELVNGFDDLKKLFGEKLTEEGIKEFRRQAGILGDTVTDTDPNKRYEKLADRLARASFHNATFSDRIWMHQDCMCSTAPYVDEKAYQEWLDSLDAENTSVTNKQIDNMSIEELQEYANRYIEERLWTELSKVRSISKVYLLKMHAI